MHCASLPDSDAVPAPSQILNALAPVQQRAVASGAANMLTSSATLAKNMHDLPSLINALTGHSTILAQCAFPIISATAVSGSVPQVHRHMGCC